MAASILLFGMPDGAPQPLKMLCASMKLYLKVIDKSRYACTLNELMSGAGAAGAGPAEFSEPMLVMAGFSKPEFDRFLQGMKRFGVPGIGLKAVLTPYNAGWSAEKLFAELSAEHAAFMQGRQKHTPEER